MTVFKSTSNFLRRPTTPTARRQQANAVNPPDQTPVTRGQRTCPTLPPTPERDATVGRANLERPEAGSAAQPGPSTCPPSPPPEVDPDAWSLKSSSNWSLATAEMESDSSFLRDPDQEAATAASTARLAADVAASDPRLRGAGRITHGVAAVDITVPVHDVHVLTRSALGLDNQPIRIHLDFHAGYGPNAPRPLVTVSQGDVLITTSGRVNPQFTLGVQLVNVIDGFLQQHWPRCGPTFFTSLCQLTEERTLNCGQYCLLCDEPLATAGLKPTICEAPLCAFQFETLGLGASTGLLRQQPKVADLLLSFAVAAGASSHAELTMPRLPVGLSRHNDMSARAVSANLSRLPSINRLADIADQQASRPGYAEAMALTRWVLATNRAHVVSLPDAEHIAAMGASHQFQVYSATREHEQRFAANKARYGSRYAFHGSAFANWHNILRQNLANGSHTAMMTSGAAFGPGIYLATQSTLAAQFARGAEHGWTQSLLGANPRCVALCEVANAPSVARHNGGNILVAPDPYCVNLRYLFVYPERTSLPAVSADALGLSPYRNLTCFASHEPVDTIPAARVLVTGDNYIWDIEELVRYITDTTLGVFINGYTRDSFSAKDVDAIVHHPSGLGLPLLAIEARNAAMGHHITGRTRARIAAAGHVLVHDHSVDFRPSNIAVAQLLHDFTLLSPEEQQALRVVPFHCTDSHSGQPFRATIYHQLQTAASGADCLHRTGDFLQQVGE